MDIYGGYYSDELPMEPFVQAITFKATENAGNCSHLNIAYIEFPEEKFCQYQSIQQLLFILP